MSKQFVFENWHKFNKEQWLLDMKSALNDIEVNNGENLYDILEDYFEIELSTDNNLKNVLLPDNSNKEDSKTI